MKKIIFIFFCWISILSYAQSDNYDLFLARQFLQNGEYAKAAEYYHTLYQQQPTTYYSEYLQVLLQLQQYDQASELIKSMYKEQGKNPVYLLDLADVYMKQQKEADAEKQYAKILKELKPNKYDIQTIAQKLIQYNQLDYAEKVYQKGKDILKDKQTFNLEIAGLLLLKNDFNGMLQAYLDEALITHDLTTIEVGLQKALTDEKQKDVLEKELLKRTQTHKNTLVYQELLVWLYMQRNDFDGAILQAKSLDLLRNENGENVLRIARTATAQKDYDAAIKGYQYVINKGAQFPWYVTANLEMINVQRDKIINAPNYTKEQLLSLKDTYRKFIASYDKEDYNAINAQIELAQLEALYIHEIDTAIALLLPITESFRTPSELLAKAKLNLGDYYIIADEPWESLLLYTQVEKEQKGNPIGEEAKYRNARLAYYKGEFAWAQSQLKIIKANTTEFISNDAIDLSVFILDNLNTDDTDFALILFAKADLLRFQHKLDAAEDTLNFISNNFIGTALTDDILYLKYKIEKDRQHYEKAATYLQQIVADFSTDILSDNALFYLGDLYQNYLDDEEKAMQYYEKIILEFKDSTFAIEARKRYRKLRGDS